MITIVNSNTIMTNIVYSICLVHYCYELDLLCKTVPGADFSELVLVKQNTQGEWF